MVQAETGREVRLTTRKTREEVRKVEITIKAISKEIADLVREVQSQQSSEKDIYEKLANAIYSEMKRTKIAAV